jgi:hypothetical protein
MDGRRFDEISRSLANPRSRRGMVKGIAGGVLAGALSLVGAGDVTARKCRDAGKNCKSDTECCSRYCDPNTYSCAATPPVATCDPACPPGASCLGGECFCPVQTTYCGADGCVDLLTDERHCGTCPTVCATGATCTAGACACPSGQAACGGTCTQLGTDTNCRSCGHACNAGSTCLAGGCCNSQICCSTGNPATCLGPSYPCNCDVFGCHSTCRDPFPCCA